MQWAIRNHEAGARAGGMEAPCAFLKYLSYSVVENGLFRFERDFLGHV
jgi:hypothetical protein